jgi:hypothetical protein
LLIVRVERELLFEVVVVVVVVVVKRVSGDVRVRALQRVFRQQQVPDEPRPAGHTTWTVK